MTLVRFKSVVSGSIWNLGWGHLFFKVGIEDQEIIVLRNVLNKSEMFAQKRYKLFTGTVVGKLLRTNLVELESDVKKNLSVASPLHFFVNVKVENTPRLDFFNLAARPSVKEIPLSRLYETDDLVVDSSYYYLVVGAPELSRVCYHLRKALSFCRSSPHVVDDFFKFFLGRRVVAH